MTPLQVRFPVAPSTVQPVFADPPARLTDVAVLDPGPILTAVIAPPPKFMVSAVVFRRSNEVDPVVKDVAIAGLVIEGVLENTMTPPDDPVSSVREAARSADAADVVMFLDESRKSALDAVKAERFIVASAKVVFPDPFASKVRLPLLPVAMVNAPLSAMLFVVNVWDPIVVPEMNVPVPLLAILVVPPSCSAPSVKLSESDPVPALLKVMVSVFTEFV